MYKPFSGKLIACRIFDNPEADFKLQITRSNRNLQKGWLWAPQLAPSWNLFNSYQAWRKNGHWPEKYPEYRNRFLKEMMFPTAQKCLRRIVLEIQRGKSVAIGCYCSDQYCHRFIVEGLIAEHIKKKQAFQNLLDRARAGEIVILEHKWNDSVPVGQAKKIVKVICADKDKLIEWGRKHGIPESWLHISRSGIPHFDLWGRMAGKRF